jgi:hypothetical protein
VISLRQVFGLGVVIGAVAAAVGAAIVALGEGGLGVIDAEDATGGRGGTVLVGLVVGAGLIGLAYAAIGVFSGWTGRDHDTPFVGAAGTAVAVAVVLSLVMLIAGVFSPALLVVPLVLGAGAAALARGGWWVGDALCRGAERPSLGDFVAPAYPTETVGYTPWTTTAGPTIRATMDELAAWLAPGAPAQARAVGIRWQLPRDLPVLVVLAGDRLGLAPVDLSGTPAGEATVLTPADLAQVSIRSLAADGSQRRTVNAFSDTIDVVGPDGRRVRFVLPYGTKGAGTTTGGPDVIRDWLRTNAASYR